MTLDIKPVADKVLSCGVVPVRFARGDWQLLILRRGRSWDFPAGVINIHEDALAAAQRETLAATGINDLEFTFGEDYKETTPTAANHVGRYYLAETRIETVTLPTSTPADNPAQPAWRWVTCEEAEDYLPPRFTHVLAWLQERIDNSE